jgi:uncharacterized CHY-type Zn-finger protein
MTKTLKQEYALCTKCMHLLTAIHFTNSNVCDICTRKEAK